MDIFNNAFNFILLTLVQEIIVVIAGVLFAQSIYSAWVKWRYGKWRVVLLKNGSQELDKELSAGKTKAILDIPEDMAVFLKGLISPFGWISCDLIDDGPGLGLLLVDRKKRIIQIDLDKNQPQEQDQ